MQVISCGILYISSTGPSPPRFGATPVEVVDYGHGGADKPPADKRPEDPWASGPKGPRDPWAKDDAPAPGPAPWGREEPPPRDPWSSEPPRAVDPWSNNDRPEDPWSRPKPQDPWQKAREEERRPAPYDRDPGRPPSSYSQEMHDRDGRRRRSRSPRDRDSRDYRDKDRNRDRSPFGRDRFDRDRRDRERDRFGRGPPGRHDSPSERARGKVASFYLGFV